STGFPGLGRLPSTRTPGFAPPRAPGGGRDGPTLISSVSAGTSASPRPTTQHVPRTATPPRAGSVPAMSHRPLRALAALGAMAAVAVVLSATPAFAHAQLTSTEPVGGTAGPAPKRIVLTFGESVEISLGSIR